MKHLDQRKRTNVGKIWSQPRSVGLVGQSYGWTVNKSCLYARPAKGYRARHSQNVSPSREAFLAHAAKVTDEASSVLSDPPDTYDISAFVDVGEPFIPSENEDKALGEKSGNEEDDLNEADMIPSQVVQPSTSTAPPPAPSRKREMKHWG